jgi:hypothetical protein
LLKLKFKSKEESNKKKIKKNKESKDKSIKLKINGEKRLKFLTKTKVIKMDLVQPPLNQEHRESQVFQKLNK